MDVQLFLQSRMLTDFFKELLKARNTYESSHLKRFLLFSFPCCAWLRCASRCYHVLIKCFDETCFFRDWVFNYCFTVIDRGDELVKVCVKIVREKRGGIDVILELGGLGESVGVQGR